MVHKPVSDNELAGIVRASSSSGDTLRISGNGHWLDAGRPVDATASLTTVGLTGIVEYVPGDLVLTARAGTSLAEIASATAAHAQWLALEPYGSSNGTIGATIATGSSGPLSTGFGRARDLVLGIAAVTGDGQRIQVGGRVVKNVAGFDLVRLLTGSWGTLGIITEVSMRLHALPQHDLSVAVQLSSTELQAQLDTLRTLPLSPMAMQLVDANTATDVIGATQSGPVLMVRLGGNAARVEAQRNSLQQLGTCISIDNIAWQSLRVLEDVEVLQQWSVFRVSRGMSRVGELFQQISDTSTTASTAPRLNATLSTGIVRVMAPAAVTPQLIVSMQAREVRVIGERLDAASWDMLPPPLERLSRGIRERFDPVGVLNPGLFDSQVTTAAAR